MKKRYIEKFVENKKVPNSNFSLILPNQDVLQMNLNDTIIRIYEENKGAEVKRTLKLGMYRNAPMEKVIQVFESLAFQFLLDDHDEQVSKEIKHILGQAVKRKDHLFIEVEQPNSIGSTFYEILFNAKKEETPFTLRENQTLEKELYNKKEFIEALLELQPSIKKVV